MGTVHVYIRIRETGRFATHFLVDGEDFAKWELAATILNMTLDQFFTFALKEYLYSHSQEAGAAL